MAQLGAHLQRTAEQCRHDFFINAMLARYGMATAAPENPFAAMSLADVADNALTYAGIAVDHNLGRLQIIGQALASGTSDLPDLVKAVVSTAAVKGYDAAKETFDRWTSRGSLPDFKPGNRAGLDAFPALDKVNENGEYRVARIGAHGEAVQLGTYGKSWAVSRQAMLSDDAGELVKLPARAGRAARRTVGDVVYSVLTANAAMADGAALFHASHSNLVAVGAAPSSASIGEAAALMGGQLSNGQLLGVRPRFLLCPLSIEGVARAVVSSQFWSGPSGYAPTRPNDAPQLEVIGDQRLTGTAWYLAADPEEFDTVEVYYLQGRDKPEIIWDDRFSAPGAMAKIRLDVAAKALDWRGLVKNPGA